MGITTTEIDEQLAATTKTDVASIAENRELPVLAVVVPCLNEELVVAETARRLVDLLNTLVDRKRISRGSFIYFVDDGSTDLTWQIVNDLHQQYPQVKGLKLARNVGTQNALLAGLLGVKDRVNCVVTIDADLQQDEQVIDTFLEKYSQGVHIVYGVRKRNDSSALLKRFSSWLFYNLLELMGARIIKHHSEYRLVSRKALEAIAQYPEYNLFLRGIFVDIGYRSESVVFAVRRRAAGKSKHGLRKLASLGFDGITSFSVVPLRIVTAFGFLIFVFSGAMTIFYLYEKAVGGTPPGWAGTVIPIYFLGGVQIMFLGLVGEYIGKIYKEVKARPRFIRDEELF